MANIKRNQTADVIRGIAILLVILGHTLTGCGIVSPSQTILFRIIWSLQMPLFVLVSGYVVLYSRPIACGKDFLRYLGKRSLSYLLPWFVWTFGVNGLLRGGCTVSSLFSYLKYILFHMDSGYWFLVMLWSVCMIFGLSQWLSKNKLLWQLVLTGCFTAVLAAISYVFGTEFLGLRYTLYYLPFFYAGFLFHTVQKSCGEKKWFQTACAVGVFLSLCFYAVSISRFNSFSAGDSLWPLLHRIAQSLSGSIVVAAAANKLCSKSFTRPTGILSVLGQKTLELYLVHSIFLNLLQPESLLHAASIEGFELVVVNFLLTLLISLLFSRIVNLSKYSRLLLFGKI